MNLKIENSLIIFKALADETRIKIIDSILEEPKTVGQIVKLINESQSCVSHQLKTLKEAEIVKCERKGKIGASQKGKVWYYYKGYNAI